MKHCKAKPISRLGWYHYYAQRFNKSHDSAAEHLACWYLLLHLELDAPNKPS